MPADLAQKILDLKASHSKSIRLRAEAQASLLQAQKNLEQVTKELSDLGIDPEKADQELEAAEQQLELTVAELTAALNSDVTQYNEILKKTRESGG